MSDEIPLTPVITRTKMTAKMSTPKSAKKRTILTKHFEESYIEEDDETYVYNETMEVDIEEEDNEDFELNSDEDISENSTEVGSVIEDKVDEPVPPQSSVRAFLVKHEIIRKVFHSSIGLITLWLYTLGVKKDQLVVPLGLLFLGVFTNDYIRLHNPSINKIVVEKMWFIIRESEINSYNGILSYLAGLFIVFSILPKDMAVMSVLLLSWADTAASTFGRKFGKYTFQISHGKSFAGALASFFTGIFSSYLLYGYFIPQFNHVNGPQDIFWKPETSKLDLHVYSILCGLIASISEFINLFNLDDNFTIPVLSGFFLYGLVSYFQV
ncbi:CTP-dependent diacylglycerol kinase 1 [[Candida] jaroonii]|uniref:CTP-dependent diacylglycerol kinase 1 n=1 Tax=[Candida] jaroonii TaxID=467808 RepID=A0ACA9Y6N7_9ASCO|nr:CTP-dependent diacylglycerol kinase 1 [[Candida] jaroonii]